MPVRHWSFDQALLVSVDKICLRVTPKAPDLARVLLLVFPDAVEYILKGTAAVNERAQRNGR